MGNIVHSWPNGVIVSAYSEGGLVSLKIEGEGERTLCDITMRIPEALAICHAITGVIIQDEDEDD